MKPYMRRLLSSVLASLIVAHLVPACFGVDSVASKIGALPRGTHIELRLKNKQRLRGTTGTVSATGFTLADGSAKEHQIAFADVASVRQPGKSHTTRNVLIGVGVGVAAIGIVVAIAVRCAPFRCGSHPTL